MLFNADEDLENADWARTIITEWPFPEYKSKKFMEMLEEDGSSLSEFRELPVYKSAIKKGLIKE